MSRRTNGTNRAAAAIGVNHYTGKLMPKKKKTVTLAEVNGRINNNLHSDYSREDRRTQW